MNEIQNTDALAAEIVILKQQTALNIIEIGKRLIQAQEQLGEGESFKSWLKNKVNFSKSTAYNFIRVAKEFNDVQALGQLGQTKVFTLLEVPMEERSSFMKENDVENMSTRELQKVIKERDQALKEKDKAEKEAQKVLVEKQKIEADINKLNESLKSEKEKSEKEISKLQAAVENTKKQLEQAESAGNNEDAEKIKASLSKTENDLLDAHKKIEELEQQLNERPIEVAATIEKIPEETEKELQELRKKVGQSQNSENLIKFKVCFDKTVSSVKDLLVALSEVKEVSEEEYEKYRRAASGLINKMLEKL